MRVNRSPLLITVAIAILAAVAFTLSSVVASDAFRSDSARATTAPNSSPQANQAHVLHAGLWRTDGSFVSTIRVKNVLVVAPIDVTPVLFMADGTPYMLSPVHIAVSGVATVNINDALAGAPSSISSHVSQFGNAALIYSYSSPGHLSAQVAAIDASRSLSYTYPFVEPMNMPGHDSKQILEGLWWKHDPGVTGFVTLSNTTNQQQTATLASVHPGNSANARQVTLAGHSTQMLSLVELAGNAAALDNHAGGIRVEYEGSQAAILVTGGLVNESEGYSANIPFWFHDMSSSSPASITYASAGLMLGKPDPMMMPGFPKETTFSPYLSLRNTTERPLDVALQLNYMSGMGMEGSAPVTRNLPAQHLAPFEAKQVELQGPLNAAGLKNFDGSMNLSISFTGRAGDLVLATGSVDQTGTYVFEVEPESVGSFRSKNTSYWGVANGNDTMFSLWNPTGSAQDILVTFYYADGSGQYKLPVHLGPQASTMIDMAMLIAEHKPDPDGNVMPSNIQEGSAQFASAKGRNEKITLVIAAGIYNVSTATCNGGCTTCCGASNFGISPNPINCPLGDTMPCTSTAVNCNGLTVLPNSWSSDTPSVMTVDSSGNVTGVSVGQATISAYFDSVIVYTGQMCGGYSCPSSSPAPTAPATVPPTVTIDSFSPNPIATGSSASVHITVNPSSTIALAITSSGSGSATFPNNTTTMLISQTSTVTILAGVASQSGAIDLLLSASYAGTVLASIQFSVTSGACTAAYTGNGGSSVVPCPHQVQIYDKYAITDYCSACQFSCAPTLFDSTFTPSNCQAITAGVPGSGNQVLTSTETGNFAANDCNVHNLQVKTTITNAQGVPKDYIGATFGLKCNSNGSPSCP